MPSTLWRTCAPSPTSSGSVAVLPRMSPIEWLRPRPRDNDDDHRADGSAPDFDALLHRLRADSMRAADLWADLVDGAATMIGAIVGRAPRPGSNQTAQGRHIDLGTVSPGAIATATFWIHNSSACPVDDVRPHSAPLRSHRGDELGPDIVSFDPDTLRPLPARSSCGVEVSVAVPTTAVPSTYFTVVLVANVPEMFLPMQLTIVPEPPVA